MSALCGCSVPADEDFSFPGLSESVLHGRTSRAVACTFRAASAPRGTCRTAALRSPTMFSAWVTPTLATVCVPAPRRMVWPGLLAATAASRLLNLHCPATAPVSGKPEMAGNKKTISNDGDVREAKKIMQSGGREGAVKGSRSVALARFFAVCKRKELLAPVSRLPRSAFDTTYKESRRSCANLRNLCVFVIGAGKGQAQGCSTKGWVLGRLCRETFTRLQSEGACRCCCTPQPGGAARTRQTAAALNKSGRGQRHCNTMSKMPSSRSQNKSLAPLLRGTLLLHDDSILTAARL